MAYVYKEGWAQFCIQPSEGTRAAHPRPDGIRQIVYDKRIPRGERIRLFLAHTETPLETRRNFWVWCIENTPLGDGTLTGEILNEDFAEALRYIKDGDTVPTGLLEKLYEFFDENNEDARLGYWRIEDAMFPLWISRDIEKLIANSPLLNFFYKQYPNLSSQIERLYLAHIKILVS